MKSIKSAVSVKEEEETKNFDTHPWEKIVESSCPRVISLEFMMFEVDPEIRCPNGQFRFSLSVTISQPGVSC